MFPLKLLYQSICTRQCLIKDVYTTVQGFLKVIVFKVNVWSKSLCNSSRFLQSYFVQGECLIKELMQQFKVSSKLLCSRWMFDQRVYTTVQGFLKVIVFKANVWSKSLCNSSMFLQSYYVEGECLIKEFIQQFKAFQSYCSGWMFDQTIYTIVQGFFQVAVFKVNVWWNNLYNSTRFLQSYCVQGECLIKEFMQQFNVSSKLLCWRWMFDQRVYTTVQGFSKLLFRVNVWSNNLYNSTRFLPSCCVQGECLMKQFIQQYKVSSKLLCSRWMFDQTIYTLQIFFSCTKTHSF